VFPSNCVYVGGNNACFRPTRAQLVAAEARTETESGRAFASPFSVLPWSRLIIQRKKFWLYSAFEDKLFRLWTKELHTIAIFVSTALPCDDISVVDNDVKLLNGHIATNLMGRWLPIKRDRSRSQQGSMKIQLFFLFGNNNEREASSLKRMVTMIRGTT
jgi:hypothetical protein